MGHIYLYSIRCIHEFQSTHPVWDGTTITYDQSSNYTDFNPPIPCGMGPRFDGGFDRQPDISIHPSRVGWDYDSDRVIIIDQISIHPSRVGWDTVTPDDSQHAAGISIHPSRVGWDGGDVAPRCTHQHFNPPIPCGMGRKGRPKMV